MISFNEHVERSFGIYEGVNDPGIFKAIFLAGGPGSGKSYVTSKVIPSSLGLKMINSDEVFELKMQRADLNLDPESIASPKGQEIRDKAKTLVNKRQKLYLTGRLGLVIDGTGKDFNKIEEQVRHLKSLGYDCYMIFVNTSEEVAQSRNLARPRSLESDLVKRLWSRVQKNIGSFQSLFGRDNFAIIDNNNANEEIFKPVFKDVVRFVKKPVENHIARKWINDQRWFNKNG